jgi:hypothetical protein
MYYSIIFLKKVQFYVLNTIVNSALSTCIKKEFRPTKNIISSSRHYKYNYINKYYNTQQENNIEIHFTRSIKSSMFFTGRP